VSEHPDQAPAPVRDPAPEDEVAAGMVGAFPDEGAPEADPQADPAAAVEDPASDAPQPEDPRTREELIVAVTQAERQRDEYLDDLRRARAEFENYRKRTSREAASARDAGRGDVATALLDVLDDLDRTLVAADDSADETLAKGVSLVAEKLSATLTGLGLARLDPLGDPFDPSLHEAVQQIAADEPLDEPVVESTLRPGYRLGERVLRPAMVVVRG
jgi:molecular chaperone GrpE